MDIERINTRVDKALKTNGRAERIVISMSFGIFLFGLAALAFAYWRQNPYIGSGTVVLEGFLYWPIREILKLRKDNLILQTLPVILAELPAEKAADEIVKLADHLRSHT